MGIKDMSVNVNVYATDDDNNIDYEGNVLRYTEPAQAHTNQNTLGVSQH